MGIKITKKDIMWSYASYILQTSAGILLLPLILRLLPSEELAIWYVFLSITALVNLLDFGLQPTIMRNVSYVYSGARNLCKEGIVEQKESLDIDYSLLKTLISSVKKIYFAIATIIALVLFTVGTRYLEGITIDLVNQADILNAWNIYILSVVFNFYFYYYTPLLTGQGRIAQSNQTIVLSKISFLLFSVIGLSSGYGLAGVAFGNLVGSIVNRVSSYYFFYDKETKMALKTVKKKDYDIFSILWTNAYKLGLVSLGSFLITKGNTLVAARYLTLETVANYGLTLQIANLLVVFSSILFRTYMPLFNQNRMIGNSNEITNQFSKSITIMTYTYLAGAIGVLLFGNRFLIILGSNILLLPTNQTSFLLIILFLEMNHTNFATLITTKNIVPFVKPAIFSGFLILGLSLISVVFLNLGLWGLLIAQGLVQGSYNNWKWPKEVLKDLDVNIAEFFAKGNKEISEMLTKSLGKKLRKYN
ncbi:O-unit flippase-like protein [Alkaliphilus peptidifermentans]|uniref:Membrane protein involved in the export of O-antigen and teichoic acid n=1 Tax=Alkaliphilus peptidifermentans DSM 18978 TaxID=1120976 RepID=A0A1G5AGE5_9FIRM|nr:O-unit flippase-like protein [Alkaliphilus peptidifermentans]SCX76968.1 Membrane protein involved in the export of O-antigen and teichoic acid [Alkaliphilus peptidifermentans DSM 18978]